MGLLIKTAIIISCADFPPIPSKICMPISCEPFLIWWKSMTTDSVPLLSIQDPLTISEQWLMFWLFFCQKHSTINFLSLNYFSGNQTEGKNRLRDNKLILYHSFRIYASAAVRKKLVIIILHIHWTTSKENRTGGGQVKDVPKFYKRWNLLGEWYLRNVWKISP